MIEHQIHNSYGNYNYNAFIYSDRAYAAHFHKNFELIYVRHGTFTITVNQTPMPMQEGELLLLAPYMIHSFVVSADASVWVGVFSKDFVQSFASKHMNKSFSKFRCAADTEEFLCTHLFHPGMPELYMAKACLYLVCNACLSNAAILELPPTHEFRSRVIEHLSSNLLENITLRTTAAALGYEYHYFSRLFHECFNLNFKEFINILRFDHACECLEDASISITQLCEKCGFQSIRNFNRIFKEMSGQTPSEYRTLYCKRAKAEKASP